jgi:hypothetical protein
MSADQISPTCLEHLPVEILSKIFDFLSLQRISTSFLSLNSHIDSVIRSWRSARHTVICNNTNDVDLLHSFPTLISHLVIVNAELVDFTSVKNLRSLMLKYGTRAQIDCIRPQNFPLLETLHIKGNQSRTRIKTDWILLVVLLITFKQSELNDTEHRGCVFLFASFCIA